jgi:hypothetical protein
VTNRERSKTFRRRRDAEQHAKLVRADLVRGVSVPARADGTRRVAEVVERWLTLHSPTLKVKTAATYAGLVRSRVLPRLGSVRLAGLRSSDVQGWINGMVSEGLSVSRIRQAHVVLAEALDWAVRDGLLAVNPARAVELPRLERRERPWLEPSTIDDLAAACPPPNDLAVLLMGYQGLRFGELAGGAVPITGIRFPSLELSTAVVGSLFSYRGTCPQGLPSAADERRGTMYFHDGDLLSENQESLIITAAPYGPSWRPDDFPGEIPVTWDEQVQRAIECYEAGASLLHIHVRDPKTGKISKNFAEYADQIGRLREAVPEMV